MTHSFVWRDSFFPPLSPPPLFFSPQCVAGNQNPVAQLDKLDRLFYNVTWLVHMFEMIFSHGTWLIHTCGLTLFFHPFFSTVCCRKPKHCCTTRHVRSLQCDMTRCLSSTMWHDSFKRVTTYERVMSHCRRETRHVHMSLLWTSHVTL